MIVHFYAQFIVYAIESWFDTETKTQWKKEKIHKINNEMRKNNYIMNAEQQKYLYENTIT